MRRQLTLFISDQNKEIEKIRQKFNPAQYALIAAHVTLCRENEIEKLDQIIDNIKTIALAKPLKIEFEPAEKFERERCIDTCQNSKFKFFRFEEKSIARQSRLQ